MGGDGAREWQRVICNETLLKHWG